MRVKKLKKRERWMKINEERKTGKGGREYGMMKGKKRKGCKEKASKLFSVVWRDETMPKINTPTRRSHSHCRRDGLEKVWRRSGDGLEICRQSGEGLEIIWVQRSYLCKH